MATIMAISKAGKDVLNSTDPNDFIFHSAYNTFKIISEPIYTGLTVDADPKTFTYAHGQSGIPAVYAFAKFPDGYVTVPMGKERADVFPYDRYYNVEIDSTNVYLIFYKGSSANYNVDVKLYIFEVPIWVRNLLLQKVVMML